MFSMVLMLVYVGMYPLKYIGAIIGIGLAAIAIFVLLSHAMPNVKLFTRVKTWESRIENYFQHKPGEDDYQISKAKTAIATGGLYGLGPGKSVQKNFLPQSSSDFIYAIIVEEYGLVGGLGVLTLYILLFIRFIIAAQKANTKFGQLVVVGLGFPIIFQALTNMAVAVDMLPVTGQPLPLISSGGSSIWMTCIALGIIIGVTKKEEEIAEEQADKERREEALRRMIDAQIAREEAAEAALLAEENFSITDHSSSKE
jgi:cell division protein FtsW